MGIDNEFEDIKEELNIILINTSVTPKERVETYDLLKEYYSDDQIKDLYLKAVIDLKYRLELKDSGE